MMFATPITWIWMKFEISPDVPGEDSAISIKDISLEYDNIERNKIIIGSKTPTVKTQNKKGEIKNVKVVLKNIKVELLRNKRFCHRCLTLFPKKSGFDDHNILFHNNETHDKTYPKFINNNQNNIYSDLNLPIPRDDNKSMNANIPILILKKCDVIKSKTTEDVQNNEPENNIIKCKSMKPCFHCKVLFPSQQSLIDHLYEILYEKKTLDENNSVITEPLSPSHTDDIEKQESVNTKETKNYKNTKKLYKCPICSYYFRIKRFYVGHLMFKHRVNFKKSIKLVEFNSKCKFCDLTINDVISYNTHLRKSHKQEIFKKSFKKVRSYIKKKKNKEKLSDAKLKENLDIVSIKNIAEVRVMVLKNILYKCVQCNIHFFTSDAAKNHIQHSDYVENWKCGDCFKVFKFKDQKTHEKQHKYSKYFTIEKVNDGHTQSNLLYKCPTCAIHFMNVNYNNHVSNCESDLCISLTNSSYCRLCDIIIDSDIKVKHEEEHELRNRNASDFTIIDTGDTLQMVDPLVPSEIFNDKTRPLNKPNECFQLSFFCCHVCKSSIPKTLFTGHSYYHCKQSVKYVCEFCGLLFTKKYVNAHKKLHQRHENLKLDNFEFYDLKSKSKIKPVTEFPKCKICEKMFISEYEVDKHICETDTHIMCSKCKINLSDTAYILHKQFHNYDLNNYKKAKIQFLNDELKTSNSHKKDETEDSNADKTHFLYSCKNCDVALNEYDDVIDHCHLHENLNKIQMDTIKCTICKLNFYASTYNHHEQLHKSYKKQHLKSLTFDVLYFGTNNSDNDEPNTWISHVFGSLPRSIIDKIMRKSIYKYENRLKMKIDQDGPPDSTLYKCERCQGFINFNSIYKHFESCRKNSKKYACKICNIPFLSKLDVSEHEKEYHTLNTGSQLYRIVSFNNQDDKKINYCISMRQKYYVLHECRYCHVIVDKYFYGNHICNSFNSKNCTKCGLLIYEDDYEMHILKHKKVESFNKNLMKVILIGTKNVDRNTIEKSNSFSMFNGIVCDYKLYKCVQCDVCVRDLRSVSDHYCLIDAAKFKCPICDFVFDEGKLKGHLKLHETDPDFTKDTVMIETFGQNEFIKYEEDKSEMTCNEVEIKDEIVYTADLSNKPRQFNDGQVIRSKIYKCRCDLHFIDIIEIEEHSKKCSGVAKSKHNCFKCGLTFSPHVLFKHLLNHHSNKNKEFKYEIIEDLIDLTR